MTTRVFDFRNDPGNVIVAPEIRGRFMRVQPERQDRMHSHDVAGESFLVVEGICEFTVDGEDVVCETGQLIYVPPQVKHALHAVGDQRCTVFLTVTPHIEPTHTRYDEHYNTLPPSYGSWRGGGRHDRTDDPYANTETAELAQNFRDRFRTVAERVTACLDVTERNVDKISSNGVTDDQIKPQIDEIWSELRETILALSAAEREWNELAPRAMATGEGAAQ
jgi:quercetin dioxygenase-like cupin family protein